MKQRHTTNIYRQLDPSASQVLLQNPPPVVTTVVPDLSVTHGAIFYFSTPVKFSALLGSLPDWEINGQTLSTCGPVSENGLSMPAVMTGAFAVGDAWTVPESDPELPFITSWTDVPNGPSNGTVQTAITNNTLEVLAVEAVTTSRVRITFAADTYMSGVVADSAAHWSAQFNGLGVSTFAGASDNQHWLFNTSALVTSGDTYTIPAGSAAFVSVTGQGLKAKTGTITGL